MTDNCSKDAKTDYDPNLSYPNGIDSPPTELLDAVEKNLPQVSYHTYKNQIFDQDDKPFVPLGVSGTGAQYSYEPLSICTSFDDLQKIVKEWKVNTYRFPIAPDTYKYGKDQSKGLISVQEYKMYIDTILIRCFSAGFKLVILDIHQGGGGVQMDQTGYDCFYNLLKKYKDIPVIAFEPLNEYPPSSSQNINQWYNGVKGSFYGVKDMLAISRNKENPETFTKNLLIIGGVDYSYQSGFLKNAISENQNFNIDTIIDYIKSILPDSVADKDKAIGLIINSHPYGYKGTSTDNGCHTGQISVTSKANDTYVLPDIPIFNDSSDVKITIQEPNNYKNWGPVPTQMGWIDSFGFLVKDGKVPIICTEFGLDESSNCIQGGFYNIALTNWCKYLNQEYPGSFGIIAWALVYENLEYVSLLTGNCQVEVTGKANVPTQGPPTLEPFDYEGPGKQFKDFVNQFYTVPTLIHYNRLKKKYAR